ncbi:GP63 leishmanolysin, partial [Leptomonas seymouri]
MRRSTSNGRARSTHGVVARLMRLAGGVLFATLVIGAFAALAAGDADGHVQHTCIHDKLQQRVFDSVAQEGIAPRLLSRVGLPYVSSASPVKASVDAEIGGADYAAVATSTVDITRSTEWGPIRFTVSAEDLTTEGYHCSREGQLINNRVGENVSCTASDIMTSEKRDILMNYLLPQALQLHRDRLRVQQVQGTW